MTYRVYGSRMFCYHRIPLLQCRMQRKHTKDTIHAPRFLSGRVTPPIVLVNTML